MMAKTNELSLRGPLADSLCFLVNRRRTFTGIELVLFGSVPGRADKRYCVSNIELIERNVNDPIPDAGFINISDKAAQNLADELWRAGVRPSEFVAADSTLEAVRDHLKDARADKEKMQMLVLRWALASLSPTEGAPVAHG